MAKPAHSTICGIGLGAENCYVAVARAGGIEILLNEYSQYSTPAYVTLGGNQRDLGTSAKQKQFTHLKSTYFAPSLLLGKKYSELNLKSFPFPIEEGPDDSILLPVNHAGTEMTITPIQLLAMVFTKLRQIGGNPVDCVINCPNFFTDLQRQEMIDAARIAGLNPLKLINDTSSVAFFHGFYRTPQEPKVLGFFDVGHSSSQCSIFLFSPKDNSVTHLDTQYETEVGGRNFDELIANHFIESQNLELNARARYRLIAECEKLKKQMSANSNDLPIGIECLYNDRDFSGRMDRTKFQELAGPLFQKLEAMLQRNLEAATEKYNKDFAEKFGAFKVDSVEIFGGSSRVPAIKQLVKTVFGIEVSTTLNADEAVARGCALQCVILSPNFKIHKVLNLVESNGVEKMEVDEAPPAEGESEAAPVESDPPTPQSVGGMDPEELNRYIDIEANLVLADKNFQEKTNAKNALEEFIYEWREKIQALEAFVEPKEKDSFLKELESNERWLYEQEDQDILYSKSVYDERTNNMRSNFANKILLRKMKAEQAEIDARKAKEAAELAASQPPPPPAEEPAAGEPTIEEPANEKAAAAEEPAAAEESAPAPSN